MPLEPSPPTPTPQAGPPELPPGEASPQPGPAAPGPAGPPPAALAPAPPHKSALAFYGVLLLMFLPGLLAQSMDPAAGLLWTEIFVFLLPAFSAAAGSNLRPRPFLRLAPPRPSLVGLGVLAGGGVFLVGSAIMELTQRLLPRAWVTQFDLTRLFEGPTPERVALALTAALVAPVCEEITFRGYVQGALGLGRRPVLAIAGSTLLFSLMHLDPVRLPALLLLGAVFGWLTWRSGSVWPAVAAHAANNGISAALALALDASEPEEAAAGGATGLQVLFAVALGLAVLVPVLLAFRRATPAPPPAAAAALPADPADASFRFSLRRVPSAHWAGYAAGLLALLGTAALGIAIRLARGG